MSQSQVSTRCRSRVRPSTTLTFLLSTFLLTAGSSLSQAPAPQPPHSPILVANPNPDALDREAIALLKEVERKYASIKTLSCQVDTGFIGPSLKPTISRHGQMMFKRPDKMFQQVGLGRGIDSARFYGNHSYVSSAGTPGEFTPIPYKYSIDSMEKSPTPLPAGRGFSTIEELLQGHGLMDRFQWDAIASVRKRREKLSDGTEVITLLVTLGYDQPSKQDTNSYSIGLKDHLIHAITLGEGPSLWMNFAQYRHVQAGLSIRDARFEVPKSAHILPLSTIQVIDNDTVTLDKGRMDGIAIGDRMAVFNPEISYYANGEVKVTSHEAHSCQATVVWNLGGLSPGDVCIIVAHQRPAN